MTLPKLPRRWATNTNYSSGPVNGTPTKVDPVSDTNGFVPGVGAAAQHVNYHLATLCDAARASVTNQLLSLGLAVQSATSEAAMAAVPLGTTRHSGVLSIKSGANNVRRHSDTGYAESVGAVASITSLVTAAVRGSTRIVAIGTGGNNNCFSTNSGVSWTAGGAMGALPIDLAWNNVHGRFMVVRATTTMQFSTDATAWSSSTVSLDSCNSGIAVFANGDTIVCGLDNGDGNDPAFSRSTNGGTSWADAGGTVPNPSTYSEAGWLTGINGNGATAHGTRIWHVGRRSANATLTVCTSIDGANWSQVLDQTPGGGVTFSARPRIWADPYGSGLLLVVATINGLGQAVAYVSTDFGDTWSDYITVPASTLTAYALAGGRVWLSGNAEIWASPSSAGDAF